MDGCTAPCTSAMDSPLRFGGNMVMRTTTGILSDTGMYLEIFNICSFILTLKIIAYTVLYERVY